MSTWPAGTIDAGNEGLHTLTAAQIIRARMCGTVRKADRGEILFQPGDTNVPLFVALSGTIAIVQPDVSGERLVDTHGPGDFTGEITMITGQKTLVRARVASPGEFLEITAEGLRLLIARDAELSEVFMRAFILRRSMLISRGYGAVSLMGSRHSADTLRLREFLSRNDQPYTYIDLDKDQVSQQLLDHFQVKLSEIPVVICGGTTVLRNPSTQQLADCLGLNASVDAASLRDLVIVGGGPAGLASGVYGASEGLDKLLIENHAPGGQASSSSKIENYLGFPTGISGQELASRAMAQAQKFGMQMMVGHSVVRLNGSRRPYEIVLDNGNLLRARAVILAAGAHYNQPRLANLEKFAGQGVYYGATYMESQLCEGADVIVVGGGNSAGQAAVFLSQTAHRVYMLVRSGNLSDTMSRYLIRRITENPAIELHYHTEVVALEGNKELEQITWLDRSTGETSTHPICHLFVMTGASPRTAWLQGCVALDEKGFILTGRDLDGLAGVAPSPTWRSARPPLMLETSLPGIFAVGDIRAGSVKRVASAVGEGSMAVQFVHKVLAE
jgi:thioredoxin reductase (NADPH)